MRHTLATLLLFMTVPALAQDVTITAGGGAEGEPTPAAPVAPAEAPAGDVSEDDAIQQDIADENAIRDQFASRIRAKLETSNFGIPDGQTRRIELKRRRMLARFDRNRWARERSVDVAINRSLSEGLLSIDDLASGGEVFTDENERDWEAFFTQLLKFIELLLELFSQFSHVDLPDAGSTHERWIGLADQPLSLAA